MSKILNLLEPSAKGKDNPNIPISELQQQVTPEMQQQINNMQHQFTNAQQPVSNLQQQMNNTQEQVSNGIQQHVSNLQQHMNNGIQQQINNGIHQTNNIVEKTQEGVLDSLKSEIMEGVDQELDIIETKKKQKDLSSVFLSLSDCVCLEDSFL